MSLLAPSGCCLRWESCCRSSCCSSCVIGPGLCAVAWRSSSRRARAFIVTVLAFVATGALVGIAAAQPVVEQTRTLRERTDAEAFVVIDVSRSMLAQSGTGSPRRLERAKTFAKTFGAALPEIRFGVVSITDRTLPHLFPSADREVFDATSIARSASSSLRLAPRSRSSPPTSRRSPTFAASATSRRKRVSASSSYSRTASRSRSRGRGSHSSSGGRR